MQSTSLLMIAAALFGSGLAIAQSAIEQTTENKPPRAVARFIEQFKTADIDDDDALTKSEAENGNMSRIVQHFDRIDANGDGKVTREEIRALVRHRVSS